MDGSKLTDLLRTFSKRDWNAFRDFVASPYFNRNDDLVRMTDWLAARAPEFAGLERNELWQTLYPGRRYENRQMNHLMSWLLKLAEQFLGVEHFAATPFEAPWHTAAALLQRRLDKHYRFNAERLRRHLEASPYRNAGHFLECYRFANLELQAHVAQAATRQSYDHLQHAADQLDFFYLTEKLNYACAMLNNQAIVSSAYQFHFVEELRRFVETHPFPAEAPGVALYFRIFQLLTKEHSDADFQVLKQLLRVYAAQFPRPEMAVLYSYALNFCIKQIRNVREAYVAEALQLYEEGVESGILLTENGRLSPWHFKNIVKLALRLRRFDWAEAFITTKHLLLSPEFKRDALHFNLAELYFYTHRYDAALTELNRVEFSDVYYNLDAKEMLAKIYYETGAHEALQSLLNAFKIYLRRNRIISEPTRKAYLNFIKILHLRLRATPDKIPALQRQIASTDLLTAKTWLNEQMRV